MSAPCDCTRNLRRSLNILWKTLRRAASVVVENPPKFVNWTYILVSEPWSRWRASSSSVAVDGVVVCCKRTASILFQAEINRLGCSITYLLLQGCQSCCASLVSLCVGDLCSTNYWLLTVLCSWKVRDEYITDEAKESGKGRPRLLVSGCD